MDMLECVDWEWLIQTSALKTTVGLGLKIWKVHSLWIDEIDVFVSLMSMGYYFWSFFYGPLCVKNSNN